MAGISSCPASAAGVFRLTIVDVRAGAGIGVLRNLGNQYESLKTEKKQINHLFQYHVEGNLVAPALPNEGDHPLQGLLLPLLADQDVRPASLLHLLHSLPTLADHHANGGVGHHNLHCSLALRVAVVELLLSLLHLLDQQLNHIRDRLLGSSDQADAVDGARVVLVVLAHHDVGSRCAPGSLGMIEGIEL